jgi:hypothetical protein
MEQAFYIFKRIFNVDATDLQLNITPGTVMAKTGAMDVHVFTSSESDESVSIIACCNAEGIFIPPVILMKGMKQKVEFIDE